MNSTLYVEYYGKQKSDKSIEEAAKAIWTGNGHKVKEIKTLDLYAKPEENRIYFVINGDFEGSFECF